MSPLYKKAIITLQTFHFSDNHNSMSWMGNWFCFIRETETGKLIGVSYPDEEEEDVINFKKSIASAFQVNLKQSAEEEETDAQSHHISHYRYSMHNYIYFYIQLNLLNWNFKK